MGELYRYNGIPVFQVELRDFRTIVDAEVNRRRLLSKNIMNDELKTFYKTERKPSFYVMFEGIRFKYPRKEA